MKFGGILDLILLSKTRFISIIVCTVFFISIFPIACNSCDTELKTSNSASMQKTNQNDWWPMFQHDIEHTGFSTTKGPNDNNVLWTFQTNGTIHSPVIYDGKIYFGTDKAQGSPWLNSYVYCLNIDGNELWFYKTEGNIACTPSIYKNAVYCCDEIGSVYCLNYENGNLIWKSTITNSALSSPIAQNNKIIICSMDGSIYCLDSISGQEIWNKQVGYSLSSTPAITENNIFIGNYCLNIDNGNVIWRSEIGLPLLSSPMFYNERVYCGSIDEFLYCHDADTGKLIWNYYTGSMKWQSSEAVAYGNIYVGSAFGFIYCVDAETGEEIWTEKNSDRAVFSPSICDEKLYIGSSDGTLYCHDVFTGQLLWKYKSGISFSNTLALAENKLLASSGNILFCFGSEQINNPDLHCEGSLSWSDLTPGSSVQGIFFVSNNGEAHSRLDWKISTVPEWGEWQINPYEGNDLTPEQGSIQVQVTLKVPDKKESSFQGNITIVNNENLYDSEQIQVTSSTIKQKNNFLITKLLGEFYHISQIYLKIFPISFPK